MRAEEQRKAFEAALAADPYDEATHRIFSDWLSEHGHDAEAEHHALWTPEWQRSYEWLEQFAEKADESSVIADVDAGEYHAGLIDMTVGDKVTVERLLRAGRVFLAGLRRSRRLHRRHTDEVCVSGMGFGAMNRTDENPGEFWHHWSVVSRTPLEEKDTKRTPFGCSCGDGLPLEVLEAKEAGEDDEQ